MSETTEESDRGSGELGSDEVKALVDGAAELFDNLKEVFTRSREEILRGAQLGKVRIDLYQLRKDRELLLTRLGAAALELLAAEEIAHAGLADLHHELRQVDSAIAEHEAEIAGLATDEDGVDVDAAANEPTPVEATPVEATPEPEPPKKAAPKAKAKAAAKPRKRAPARTKKTTRGTTSKNTKKKT